MRSGLIDGDALGLLATNLDLGHQLQPGHMNEAELPFQFLPGIEPIAFLIYAGMARSGIVLCPVCLDPFGRNGVWNLHTRTAYPGFGVIAVPGLHSSN